MDTSSKSDTNYRSLATKNNDKSVNEYLDNSTSVNTKKSNVTSIKLFNSTMESLNHHEQTDKYKTLDEWSLEELPAILSKFVMVVNKEDGTCFNSSSLNTYFQALARHFKSRDIDPVDIMSDVRFSKVREVLKARCLEAAKSGSRAGVNASECLHADELKVLMKSTAMSRDNPRGLISLIHYTIMTGMGVRARQECRDIKNSDLIYGPGSEFEGRVVRVNQMNQLFVVDSHS